jgi:hypothetical protein
VNKKLYAATVESYRALAEELAAMPEICKAVKQLVAGRTPAYEVLRPAVFNSDLNEKSAYKMILVADNPGRREQEAGRYLVGPSGKIAEGFFSKNPNLGIDFRADVLILNKTPIHTPRTVELKELCRIGGERVADAVRSSQGAMAELLASFWRALGKVPVWIIGYSEMKRGGIFEPYTEKLKALCAADKVFAGSVFFYRHFSMNQFTIDLSKQRGKSEALAESLARIGASYRERVLG